MQIKFNGTKFITQNEARELINKGKTESSSTILLKPSLKTSSKDKKVRKSKSEKTSRSLKTDDGKEDSGQGTSSGEELKLKKVKKEKSKKSKDESKDGEKSKEKRKKKKKKTEEVKVIRINKIITKPKSLNPR